MLYTSEKTKKSYKTIAELETAEKEFDTKMVEVNKTKLERSEAAKKVEEALDAITDAQNKVIEAKKTANTLLANFNEKYGPYHRSFIIKDGVKTTIEEDETKVPSIADLIDALFSF